MTRAPAAPQHPRPQNPPRSRGRDYGAPYRRFDREKPARHPTGSPRTRTNLPPTSYTPPCHPPRTPAHPAQPTAHPPETENHHQRTRPRTTHQAENQHRTHSQRTTTQNNTQLGALLISQMRSSPHNAQNSIVERVGRHGCRNSESIEALTAHLDAPTDPDGRQPAIGDVLAKCAVAAISESTGLMQ